MPNKIKAKFLLTSHKIKISAIKIVIYVNINFLHGPFNPATWRDATVIAKSIKPTTKIIVIVQRII